MVPLHSPNDYLFNLYATNSGEAKRIWKRDIKDQWGNKCAYCNSDENLTLDHIVPQSKGGLDTTKNVVCCCKSCNHSKGHTPWEEWYYNQDFFSYENYNKIKTWMKPEPPTNLYSYRQRKNNVL
jgi:hypothetical protein